MFVATYDSFMLLHVFHVYSFGEVRKAQLQLQNLHWASLEHEGKSLEVFTRQKMIIKGLLVILIYIVSEYLFNT